MDERLEKIYLKELEDTVKLKFEENNMDVIKCEIDAILDTTKKNAGIHSIVVKIKNTDNMEIIADIKKALADEFEINKNIITVK